MPSYTGVSRPIGWIPLLGFGPSFATTLYESLVDSFDLRGRVFPLVGFPAYDPSFFERTLTESARVILEALQTERGLRDQFLYAGADNPFETVDVVKRLVTRAPSVAWIASPMGPKPMALGMCLAALDHNITMMICQARSYHPDYSSGVRCVHAYLLKLDGSRCY